MSEGPDTPDFIGTGLCAGFGFADLTAKGGSVRPD
jgi:hypothetical protein